LVFSKAFGRLLPFALVGAATILAAAAFAESDAVIRDLAPTVEPAPAEPAEIGEPIDLRPPEPAPPPAGLKIVVVPLPPVFARQRGPAPGAAPRTEPAAEATAVTQGDAASVLRERLAAPFPGDPSANLPPVAFAPSISPAPSSVLDPTVNPAIPPLPGSALPVVRAPPEAHGGNEDEEDENTPGSVETQTDFVDVACLKPELLDLIRKTGEFFRQIPIITSGYRARGRAGSYHKRCMAADFIVPGISQQTLVAYLRHLPGAGGVGTYCHTKAVHLDIGEKRDWGYCGFRRTYFSLRE